MSRRMGNDGDWQRHNADRNGQEGRGQDRGATSYEVHSKQLRGSVLYLQLSGRGPQNGIWFTEDELKREYPAVHRKMLRQG